MYTFKICKVFSVSDDTDSDLIKVRFRPDDDKISRVEDLPDCFPLLPKMFWVKPKVGEAVLVFTTVTGDGASQRYYIGPLISQAHKMHNDPYDTAISFTDGAILGPDKAPSTNPDTRGVYPKDDSVSLRGRGACDIQINDDDLRIRCGVKISNNEIEKRNRKIFRKKRKEEDIFNKQSPAYMKLKFHRNASNYSSTATIVADKINLITHNIGRFNLTDRDDLISDKAMDEIINKAHQLPYGDILIEFLEIFRRAFLSHVHPYPGLPPCITDDVVKASSYSLKDMLSENVRIE